MTTYGTIPTSSAPGTSTSLDYISRAKDRFKQGLSTRQPWRLFFNFRSFKLPSGFSDAFSRLRANFTFFRMNYTIIVLIILFLSLLWHPISLIVFIVMMAAWLFLYFLRDEPLVVFNRTIDDRIVLGVLGVLTIVFLLFTHVTMNVLISVLVGVCVVLLHGVFRTTDDLLSDDQESALISPS